jgi:putative PIN family toxin of toxin-antitoxin system
MRAVVDSNILIRAVIKPGGTVGPVLRRLVRGDYVLVYSRPLLAELLEKLELPRIKEKYSITDDDIADLIALFVLRGDLVIPEIQVTSCRDPEDNMVIEAALAGEAPWVVTGDEDLLTLGTYETVSFVTPRAFLQRLDEERLGTNADEAPDSGDST